MGVITDRGRFARPMGFPYLVPSMLSMAIIAAVLLGGLWLAIRIGL
jgi:hypothetical protein